MKFLLLLGFFSNVLAAEPEITMSIKNGHCPGTLPFKEKDGQHHFAATLMILVTVDKASQMIEHVQYLRNVDDNYTVDTYSKHENEFFWKYKKELPYPVNTTKKEIHVVLLVQGPRDDMMKGIDNQIYYGYNENQVAQMTGKPHKELGERPFRIGGITIKYTSEKGGKQHEIYSIQEKDCNQPDAAAWIANHGIYRVMRRPNGSPFFKNLYYWPQVGRLFT